MTLSNHDQEKMEAANPYPKKEFGGGPHMVWEQGYTAACADRDGALLEMAEAILFAFKIMNLETFEWFIKKYNGLITIARQIIQDAKGEKS